jgi:hypothetical protein
MNMTKLFLMLKLVHEHLRGLGGEILFQNNGVQLLSLSHNNDTVSSINIAQIHYNGGPIHDSFTRHDKKYTILVIVALNNTFSRLHSEQLVLDQMTGVP